MRTDFDHLTQGRCSVDSKACSVVLAPKQCQAMRVLSLICFIPAVLDCAHDVCRQPLAPLPQPQSDAPQQQQQHHSSSQQSRQAAAAQQPVLHKESQHKPPQQQQKQRQPQQLQQAQQQQQQKRRVREDENSVIVRGNRYTKLECVGRGGSSKVFKVRVMITMHAFVLEALSS